jgi:glycosyltransferase involved in cell wall biosynthesis
VKPRKIAILSPSLEAGGAERVVLNLARGFVQQGNHVHLLLANASGKFLEDIPEKVVLFDFGKTRVSRAYKPLLHYLRLHKPDILLSTQTHANIMASFACIRARLPTKLVLGEHSTISQNLGPPLGAFKGKIIRILAKQLFLKADAIVAVSSGVAEDLMRVLDLPQSKLRVIYNPIDIDEILLHADEPLDDGDRFLVADGPALILAVGRLTKAKNYSALLRVFAQVRQKNDAHLLILGEGEERGLLDGLVKELGLESWVRMPGYVKNPYPYMSRADIFVLSSDWEGFPVVLVEALACGTPVVSTDCRSGPAEILGHGRYGALVPVGDLPALTEAILQTLDVDTNRAELRKRAHQFSAEQSIKQYLNLFDSL